MNVRILIKGVMEKSALREYAEDKIAAALRRFEDRILGVTVRLEDVTGPRKQGVDKQCRIDLRIRPVGQIIIQEHASDLQAALLTALDRLKAAISRKTAMRKRGVGRG